MVEENDFCYIQGTKYGFEYKLFDSNETHLDLSNKKNTLNFEILKHGKVILSDPIKENPYKVNFPYLSAGKYSYRVLSYTMNEVIQFGRIEIIPSLVTSY